MPQPSSLSPRATGRLAAIFYLINIGAGASALALTGRAGTMVLLLATLAYVAVTWLFYGLFRPVTPRGSALAAGFSFSGCALSLASALGLAAPPVAPLGFFGLYCLALGVLILRSTFVPRLLGGGLMLAGLAWLTFFSSTLAAHLTPYNMAPGILAEVALTLWLLIVGIDDTRWRAQRGASSAA